MDLNDAQRLDSVYSTGVGAERSVDIPAQFDSSVSGDEAAEHSAAISNNNHRSRNSSRNNNSNGNNSGSQSNMASFHESMRYRAQSERR